MYFLSHDIHFITGGLYESLLLFIKPLFMPSTILLVPTVQGESQISVRDGGEDFAKEAAMEMRSSWWEECNHMKWKNMIWEKEAENLGNE